MIWIWAFLLLLCQVSAETKPQRGFDSYTTEELDLIPKLRSRVGDGLTQRYMFEKKYLVRYLRAKSNDLNKAEKMMRQNFQWRKENKVDSLIFQNFSSMVKRMPFYFSRARNNRPVVLTSLKNVNAREILLRGEYKKMKTYVLYGAERLVWNIHLAANETGQEFIEGYLLINLAGFNARSHACIACLPLWIEIAESYEKYYPRMGYKLISINVPKIFVSLLDTVRPFLSADTVQRFQIYSVDKGEWQPELLKIFPKENLEIQFGGTAPSQELYKLTPAHFKIMLG